MSQETVIMDNDLLIDQARKLYAGLLVKQLIVAYKKFYGGQFFIDLLNRNLESELFEHFNIIYIDTASQKPVSLNG
jgi:hypothetical protein